jgi:rare lipoprotein A
MGKGIAILGMLLMLPLAWAGAYEQTGMASWYGGEFHGKKTANGEIFNTYEFTAAHKELPFNTVVTVTNLTNGKTVKVRINDRGPFVAGRVIDLSYAAAKELGMVEAGTSRVKIATEDFENLEIRYSIQVGAFRNLTYANALIERLQGEGFEPVALLTNTGVTRVLIEGVREEDLLPLVSKLENLGYRNLLVKQN